MKLLNTTSPPRLIALLAGAAMLGLVSQTALAAGTASGTTISNLAKLSYSVGGTAQQEICSSSTGNSTGNGGTTGTTCTDGVNGAGNTSFRVDEKINLTVAGTGSAISVIPGALAKVATFTVTNNSNSALDFSLAVNQPVGGSYLTLTDNFDATGCIVRVESGATGGYQSGEDTGTFIDELAADGSKTVYVVCDIPAGKVNGDAAIVGLTATAQGDFTGANNTYAATASVLGAAITETGGANTANVDIVFADVQGTETGGDSARDAKHSARDVYSVATSAITVTKTATLVCDPFNGTTDPKNIPGAMTRWTIKVANGAGGADATLTTVADTLAASLAHDANYVVPTNAATCSSGTGVPESAAGKGFKVTVDASRVLGGSAAGAGTVSYFTTADDADGVELVGQAITATFATILPVDGGTGHGTAGLLKANEWVEVIFNTTVQ